MSLEVEKSFLVQKFAKLQFGPTSLIGYSVAGEETVVQAPELNVCFDIGRAPPFCADQRLRVHHAQPHGSHRGAGLLPFAAEFSGG